MIRHFLMGIISFLLLSVPHAVLASSYNVSASVPFDIPSQPATIASNLQNTISTSAAVTVSGTCQRLIPVTIVTIWRDRAVLGSVACQLGGTYSLQIMLTGGVNNLVAKTANISNVYGPSSTAVSITYNPPKADSPPPIIPSLSPVQIAANKAEVSDLQIHTAEPFSVLPITNVVTISVTVSGGTTPYEITLNWGDGATDSKTENSAGTFDFKHTYDKPGSYAVKAKVRDVLGAETEYEFAVVSVSATPALTGTPNGGIQAKPNHKFSVDSRWFLAGAPMFFAGAFFVGRSYQLHILSNAKMAKIPRKK